MDEVLTGRKTCLLVKLLSQKYFNREAFKSIMRKEWKPTKLIRFHKIGEGIMLVEFEDIRDKTRVIIDGPWNFDKYLILVKEFDGVKQVKNIRMDDAFFLVRIHDLPLMACNEYVD